MPGVASTQPDHVHAAVHVNVHVNVKVHAHVNAYLKNHSTA
jgi:hypothetical protein